MPNSEAAPVMTGPNWEESSATFFKGNLLHVSLILDIKNSNWMIFKLADLGMFVSVLNF